MSKHVPTGWQDVIVDDCCKIIRGASPRPIGDPSYFGGNVGWVRISDVTASSKYLRKTQDYLSPLGVSKSVKVTKGDLIMSICGTVGRPIIVDMEACIHDGFVQFTKINNFDVEYCYYLLQTLINEFISKAQPGTQINLNTTIVGNTSIPLPPLPEQRKIAAVLSSADRSIAATEKLIAKLADLKKALMQQLLTKGIGHTEFKPSQLGQIPKSWEVMELNNLVVKRYGIVDGPFGSNLKTIHYRSEGIPIIQSGFVASNYFKVDKYLYVDIEKFNEQKRSAVHGGDIVMAKIGANCGGCAILPHNHPESILAGNSLKITPDNAVIKTEFLLYLLHYLQDIGVIDCIKTVTAQPAISLSSLKTLDIPVPPMSEQNKIAGSICTVDRKLSAAKVKLAKAKDLKQGLMNDLLTGKVRVSA